MTPKIVFFDIGNVFMTYDRIFTRLTADFSLPTGQFSDFEMQYDPDANLGKIDIPQIWQKFVDQYQVKNASNYNIISSWVSDYQSILPLHELSKKIATRSRVGIISNYYHDFFAECLRQQFIPDLPFDPVIISADVGVAKPDRAIYDIAQERSGFQKNDIFFIDDKAENLVVPRSLGWQTYQFDYKNPAKSCDELSILLL